MGRLTTFSFTFLALNAAMLVVVCVGAVAAEVMGFGYVEISGGWMFLGTVASLVIALIWAIHRSHARPPRTAILGPRSGRRLQKIVTDSLRTTALKI